MVTGPKRKDCEISKLMKPYYQDEYATIYHGDCREILPTFEKVDLVLTDPPYGISLQNNGKKNDRRRQNSYKIEGDNSQIGQNVIDWAHGLQLPLIAFADSMNPWEGDWRQWLVWDKGGAVGGGGDIATCWKQTWEMIQIARTGKLSGNRDSAVLRFWVTPQLSKDHIAAKPVELIRYLIGKCTAGVVLDPFMGSGTTLRAAKDLGLQSIGIEIEEKYCEIAAERLRQEVLAFAG